MLSTYCGQTLEHALGLHQRVPQAGFSAFLKMNDNSEVEGSIAKALAALPAEDRALYKAYSMDVIDAGDQLQGDYAYKARKVGEQDESLETTAERRKGLSKNLIKNRALQLHGGAETVDLSKAGVPGVTTSLGLNFYDLRPPVELLYPVNVPIRNSLARVSRVNDGWGTAAHWMATRVVGSSPVNAEEGKRVGYSQPDNNQYVATYKEIGVERSLTFTAQPAGEGLADNMADEHLRGLHSLFLGEEGMDLLGNSGTATGNNGYALGLMVYFSYFLANSA